MKTGFIFAGQGQQFFNMGKDLAENHEEVKAIYDLAASVLAYNPLDLSEEDLKKTLYTQPALYVLNHSIDVLMKEKGIVPDFVCGLSLGEYNALLSAEVFDFTQGLKLIQKRAHIMQYALEENTTAMVACLKTSQEAIAALIDGTGLEICNFNTPSQIVIGGYKKDIEQILPILKEAKIMAVPLKVSTVSHMSLLKDASLELREELLGIDFQSPKIDFINNLEAKVQKDGFADTLSRHIAQATHLSESIQLMQAQGIERFIEIGPKGSISKFVKEICGKDALVYNVYDEATLGAIV